MCACVWEVGKHARNTLRACGNNAERLITLRERNIAHGAKTLGVGRGSTWQQGSRRAETEQGSAAQNRKQKTQHQKSARKTDQGKQSITKRRKNGKKLHEKKRAKELHRLTKQKQRPRKGNQWDLIHLEQTNKEHTANRRMQTNGTVHKTVGSSSENETYQ